MSLAIIVHREANGIDGGALGAAENTFYTHKLTDMLINESSTVLAFRKYDAAINANQFDLAPALYRITADIVFCNYNNSGTVSTGTRAGLFNVTDGDYQYYFASTTEKILSASSLVTSTPSGGSFPETNAITRFDGLFNVTDSVKSFEIRQAIQNNGSYPPTANDVLGDKSTVTASTLNEYYAFIKILKMST